MEKFMSKKSRQCRTTELGKKVQLMIISPNLRSVRFKGKISESGSSMDLLDLGSVSSQDAYFAECDVLDGVVKEAVWRRWEGITSNGNIALL
jgi:hypothetical protein